VDDKRNVNGVAQSLSDGNTNKYGLYMLVPSLQCCPELEVQTSRLVELVLSSARSFALMEVFAMKASRVF
jgi:hypothetical protein